MKQGILVAKPRLKVIFENMRIFIPAKRVMVTEQECRSRSHQTAPSDAYQMDWGFVRACMQTGKYEKNCGSLSNFWVLKCLCTPGEDMH